MEEKRILLNCLPPTAVYKPGYSLSVIKSYLCQHGYEAHIKYWNLYLRDVIESFWMGKSDEIPLPWLFKDLMPFFTYYAIERNNTKVKQRIMDMLGKYIRDVNIERHLTESVKVLKQSISEELLRMDVKSYDYVYVQSKFYKYELISTGVFCEILKKINPNSIIIIEAQEFPRKALAMIDSFKCYDYATWGEYEKSLLSLLDALSLGQSCIADIPNIVYRGENGLGNLTSSIKHKPIDLNSTPFADFSDYLEQTDVPLQDIIFPLESGRGCHWNKCSFCYMNDGYYYRKKSNKRMLEEIRHYRNEYGAQYFYFIDNDLIGHNPQEFKRFLEGVIALRRQGDLKFEFGEFIAKDLDENLIRLIGDAGFQEIQIGYESTSDRALKLINKKSRFANLILVSNWALHYGIGLSPQNILRSMPFETDSIVLDNIKNLYYLRFLLANKNFRHSLRELCVVSTSKYYEQLSESNRLSEWDSTPMQEYMVDDLIKPEYKYDVFLMGTRKFNPLWKLFKKTEQFYIEQNYSYKIVKGSEGIFYLEFVNKKQIASYCLTEFQIDVLRSSEKKVCSLSEISRKFSSKSILELKATLYELKEKGLMYYSDDFNEIVSIIITPPGIEVGYRKV